MNKYIIIALLAILVLPLSFADAAKSLPELVDKFFEAVKSQDKAVIEKTYKDLAANEEVLETTKNEHPDYYKLYEAWTAVFKAEGFRDLAGTSLGSELEFPEVVVKERANTIVPSQRSNQAIAASYPNQDRPSNQVSIKRRLRSMR